MQRCQCFDANARPFAAGFERQTRGTFKTMTGLAPRTADRLLKALFDRDLLRSDSPKGVLRFGVPLHALRFYFPALWPEAEAGQH